MSEDFQAGLLNLDHMEMFIGGGTGMYVVARALLEDFASSFPEK
jgi:hypothetical protein